MEIFSNQVLITACISWLVAQVLKTIIDYWCHGQLSVERLYGNGGMPSSHSSTVCALAAGAAHAYGLGSFEFAISFILAAVVMVDAMGVRRETGKQSQLLNMILEHDFFQTHFATPEMIEMSLKEFIGHTPLQVLCGAVLGVVVAELMEVFVYAV